MSLRAPIVIVSGYLGAGKTTFLREIIPQLVGSSRPPYVILNDFSNAEVDSALLREVAPDVTPVSGGCICCDSSTSLIKALEKIPDGLEPIVFIEANGMDKTKIRRSLASFHYQPESSAPPSSNGIPSIVSFLANRCK